MPEAKLRALYALDKCYIAELQSQPTSLYFQLQLFEDLEFYSCRNTVARGWALAILFKQNLTLAGRLSLCCIHVIFLRYFPMRSSTLWSPF